MPDERTVREQTREQLREFRRIVASAVGELRSNQIRDAYAALSIEELMDQHVARLQDTTDPINPSRKQRVERVYQQLVDNIEGMKAVDPARFRPRDPDNDVNTSRDVAEEDFE